MDFNKQLKKYQSCIDKELMRSVDKSIPIYEPLRYILKAGGKRIRPLITILSCETVGGDYRDALKVASALELLHTFTLIHDDIMDNADERRGFKTIHKKWDLSTGILAGDLMAGVSYVSLAKNGKNTTKIFGVFTRAFIEVCEGQDLDVRLSNTRDVAISQYLEMINKKTASLISASAEIGGLIGNGKNKQINALKNYGRYLGIAFQMQDDLIDIVGDRKLLGKPVGQDIKAKKNTFLFLKALELSDKNNFKNLLTIFDKPDIKLKDINNVRNIYLSLGVDKAVKAEYENYTSKALSSLNQLPSSSAREMLYWLTNKILGRRY